MFEFIGNLLFRKTENTVKVKTKKIVDNMPTIDEVKERSNQDVIDYISSIFKDESIYVIKYTRSNKPYIMFINDEALALFFTTEEKIKHFIDSELKDVKKDISIDKFTITDFLNFIESKPPIEGVIIDYPFDWQILRVK